MGKREYVKPTLVALGEAAELTQGTGFGGCKDFSGTQKLDCLVSATDAFCRANPTDPHCL